MFQVTPDLYCLATYYRETSEDDLDAIGFYSFRCLDVDERAKPESVLLYGARVLNRDGRIIFDYDGGDPPSSRAGRAVDLHRAAAARVRADALKLTDARAYFIDDSGKVAEAPLASYWAYRVPALVAASATMECGADLSRLHELITGVTDDRSGSTFVQPEPATAPPSPASFRKGPQL